MWGFFVALEGIEGTGKSTLLNYLAERLRELGLPVVKTREPGGTPAAELVRGVLMKPGLELDPWAELFLFLAARRENTYKVILPALREGKVVISDRYYLSSLAYQGFGRGLPLKLVSRLNKFATGGLKPHLTILIDLEPAEALRRARGEDRFHREELEFHRRVREGYLTLARKAGKRVRVLDGRLPKEELAREAFKLVEERLREKGRLK